MVIITVLQFKFLILSLQMGSFAIGTVAAATTSLIFMVLVASGDAALGEYIRISRKASLLSQSRKCWVFVLDLVFALKFYNSFLNFL